MKALQINPEDLKITQGKDNLRKYQADPSCLYHCDTCGILVYIYVPASWSDEYCKINITSLNDITPNQINSIETVYLDGKSDTWDIITDPEIMKSM